MADIVLGIGTSHTPLLSLAPELWPAYAERDQFNGELAYPPNGWVMSFEEGKQSLPAEIREKYQGPEPFKGQYERHQRALNTLARSLQDVRADITIVISDDQDEWFYEHNMPMFSIYWGDTAPLRPRGDGGSGSNPVLAAITAGYGDTPMDVPIASAFGRYLIEYLVEHDFDMAHMNGVQDQPYGGKIARRYPTPDGELQYSRDTPPHEQGLPHGYAFIVKRLYNNEPRPLLPVIQNTCYPPNTPSPRRSYMLGEAIAEAVKGWDREQTVAIVASGGLSHFVVDEEFDRTLLGALERKDEQALKNLPRHRMYSATSESLNWVALGGAMKQSALQMELVDYVPVYRTPAATGGGWAFARWI